MTGHDIWNLSKLASAATDGWFFVRVDENTRILVHAGDKCVRQDCPDKDWAHTHVPTELHLAEMRVYAQRFRNAVREQQEIGEAMIQMTCLEIPCKLCTKQMRFLKAFDQGDRHTCIEVECSNGHGQILIMPRVVQNTVPAPAALNWRNGTNDVQRVLAPERVAEVFDEIEMDDAYRIRRKL